MKVAASASACGDRNVDSDASFEVDGTVSPNSKRHDGVGLVVEIFAGSCRLSKACGKLGLRALPIEKD